MADRISGPEEFQRQIEAAWQDFVADMRHEYPTPDWPSDKLLLTRASMLTQAEREQQEGDGAERIGNGGEASEHYVRSAEFRRDANGIAALLIDEGHLVMEGDAVTTLEYMERAVSGDTEAPRWLTTTRHPETGEKGQGAVIQPEEDALADALWEQAAGYAGVKERYLTIGLLREDPENVMAFPLPTYATQALVERAETILENWERDLSEEEGPLTPEQKELWTDIPAKLSEIRDHPSYRYSGRESDYVGAAENEERYREIMRLQEDHRAVDAPYIVAEPSNASQQWALNQLTFFSDGAVYFRTVPEAEFGQLEAHWQEWAGAKQMLTAQYALERGISVAEVPELPREYISEFVADHHARGDVVRDLEVLAHEHEADRQLAATRDATGVEPESPPLYTVGPDGRFYEPDSVLGRGAHPEPAVEEKAGRGLIKE